MKNSTVSDLPTCRDRKLVSTADGAGVHKIVDTCKREIEIARTENRCERCGQRGMFVDINQAPETLNLTASAAHVTPSLVLGNVCVNGDPTFYNLGGDVIINTDLYFPGAPLAVVASGNILAATGAKRIDTSNSGVGGAITLVAGGLFTASNTSANPFAPVTN